MRKRNTRANFSASSRCWPLTSRAFMTEGMDSLEDFYLAEGGIITVNTETAQVLGVDYSVFKDMGTLVEVGTTED